MITAKSSARGFGSPGRKVRHVAARFRRELHPSYYEAVQTAITNLQVVLEKHDAEVLESALANDFIMAASERQQVRPMDKPRFVAATRQALKGCLGPSRVVATAVCPGDSAAVEGVEERASGFVLMEYQDADVPETEPPYQGVGRIIINRDGQVRVFERFRPLMGTEPDRLLRDPAGYRKRIMEHVPRLEVTRTQGDVEKMQDIVMLVARDLFSPGSYNGDALDFMTDDVVMYEGHGDSPVCPITGGDTVLRGKAEIDAFARKAHAALVGSQQMLGTAASEETNTAFAHFAMLVMGKADSGWVNAAHRTLMAVTFDDACEKVNGIAYFRTFTAYERDESFVALDGDPLGKAQDQESGGPAT